MGLTCLILLTDMVILFANLLMTGNVPQGQQEQEQRLYRCYHLPSIMEAVHDALSSLALLTAAVLILVSPSPGTLVAVAAVLALVVMVVLLLQCVENLQRGLQVHLFSHEQQTEEEEEENVPMQNLQVIPRRRYNNPNNRAGRAPEWLRQRRLSQPSALPLPLIHASQPHRNSASLSSPSSSPLLHSSRSPTSPYHSLLPSASSHSHSHFHSLSPSASSHSHSLLPSASSHSHSHSLLPCASSHSHSPCASFHSHSHSLSPSASSHSHSHSLSASASCHSHSHSLSPSASSHSHPDGAIALSSRANTGTHMLMDFSKPQSPQTSRSHPAPSLPSTSGFSPDAHHTHNGVCQARDEPLNGHLMRNRLKNPGNPLPIPPPHAVPHTSGHSQIPSSASVTTPTTVQVSVNPVYSNPASTLATHTSTASLDDQPVYANLPPVIMQSSAQDLSDDEPLYVSFQPSATTTTTTPEDSDSTDDYALPVSEV